MNYRHVLFDLDGTLVDTAPDMCRALNRLCRETGRPTHDLKSVRPYVSRGAVGVMTATMGAATKKDVARFLEIYQQDLVVESRLFDGMEALLQAIECGGSWGVVSNKAFHLASGVIDGLDLKERCRVLIGGDSLSNRKPHPEPVLAACKALGADPEAVLFVGDDARDIQAGKAAGCPTAAAAWGYLPPGETASSWQADILAQTAADLHELMLTAA